ncbi:MAG: response regulator transcription factor [Clostridiales bacterium]|nr:response regulator transcription factor [Clostridiales bacterium]
MKTTILIVEDELPILRFMKTTLQAQSYHIVTATNAAEAETMLTSHCPDLVLLDLCLPDKDGMLIIKNLRKWSSIPVIVVSARTSEADKVKALDLGADDYITKPFGSQELLARIRTALRHAFLAFNETAVSKCFEKERNGFYINFATQEVKVNGESIHLTQNEYKLLSYLAKNSGKVLTYNVLNQYVWGPYNKNDTRTLRVNMSNIRRKIEPNPGDPMYIYTEVGIGYRMIELDN